MKKSLKKSLDKVIKNHAETFKKLAKKDTSDTYVEVRSHVVGLTLLFDNEEARARFVADWLDGGLDGGGNLDWNTEYKESSQWEKGNVSVLRIKGTGCFINESGEIEDE